jgi:uncharacterized protein (TIGR02452 family)
VRFRLELKGMSGAAGGGVVVQKLGASSTEESRPSPTQWRTHVWRDTYARAHTYPFRPTYKLQYMPEFHKTTPFSLMKVSVSPEDTLIAAQRLLRAGLNPAALNFADDTAAGGSVDVGSGAQEESLWRRTNLCSTQLQSFYPLRGEEGAVEGLYTHAVTVFKSPEADGCKDLAEPWQIAVVSVPAIPYPFLERGRMGTADTALFRKKIELILQIAHGQGHDSLVLGAFGCGAWRGPPQQIAELFREVLREWNGVFREVVFACLHDEAAVSMRRGTYRGNYDVFQEVLGGGL